MNIHEPGKARFLNLDFENSCWKRNTNRCPSQPFPATALLSHPFCSQRLEEDWCQVCPVMLFIFKLFFAKYWTETKIIYKKVHKKYTERRNNKQCTSYLSCWLHVLAHWPPFRMLSVTSLIFHFMDTHCLAIQIENIWILVSTDEVEYLFIHECEASILLRVCPVAVSACNRTSCFLHFDLLSVFNIVSKIRALGCTWQ